MLFFRCSDVLSWLPRTPLFIGGVKWLVSPATPGTVWQNQGCWIWFSPIWPMWHPKPGDNPSKKRQTGLLKRLGGPLKDIYIYIEVGRLTPKKLNSWQHGGFIFFNKQVVKMLTPNHGDDIILIPMKLTNMKICFQIGYNPAWTSQCFHGFNSCLWPTLKWRHCESRLQGFKGAKWAKFWLEHEGFIR